MNSIISRFGSILAGHNFFQDKDLCPLDIATSRFTKALEESRAYYRREKDNPVDPALIHESWKENIYSLESYFTNSMDENFVSNGVINGTMVFTDKKAHKIELEKMSGAIDKRTLDRIIGKNLNSAFIMGKSRKAMAINSVHHLYHLMQFERMTGRKMDSMRSVVEFGGGYGNMARIIDNVGKLKTYSIIDLLLFSCIQYIFLCTAAGAEQAAFRNDSFKRNPKYILHPLSLADPITTLSGELFLSTWALSESTRAAYDLVTQADWFGAANMLIAYNIQWKPWQDEELAETLRDNGWHVAQEAIPFLPDSFYLCATR